MSDNESSTSEFGANGDDIPTPPAIGEPNEETSDDPAVTGEIDGD